MMYSSSTGRGGVEVEKEIPVEWLETKPTTTTTTPTTTSSTDAGTLLKGPEAFTGHCCMCSRAQAPLLLMNSMQCGTSSKITTKTQTL